MSTHAARIKEYWNDRAAEQSASPAATTNDIHLRDLEIATLVQELGSLELPSGSVVADVGCGDAFSTVGVAERLPDLRFVAVDYSEQMIQTAQRNIAESRAAERIDAWVGDATDLGSALARVTPTVIVTDRVLINLESVAKQLDVVGQIAQLLPDGGTYLAIENFQSGQDELTRARTALGLAEIPVRWHNLYLQDAAFLEDVSALFSEVRVENFASAYYFATRVIYSAMCAMRGEEPDYDHEIHRLAPGLPAFGNFSPVRLAVLRK